MKILTEHLNEFTKFSDEIPDDGVILLGFRLTKSGQMESYCRRKFYRDLDYDTTYPLTHYKIIDGTT